MVPGNSELFKKQYASGPPRNLTITHTHTHPNPPIESSKAMEKALWVHRTEMEDTTRFAIFNATPAKNRFRNKKRFPAHADQDSN